ncbi:MAG TPA: ribonuclease R [Alphaproteobacteria bacterium]
MKKSSKPPVKPKSAPKSRQVRKPATVVGSLTAASLFAYVRANGGTSTKADIIQHFALEGQQQVMLRQLIQEMTASGQFEKDVKQMVRIADTPREKRAAVAASFIGIFNAQRRGGGIIKSTQRQDKTTVTVTAEDTGDAHNGDLVEVKQNKVVRVIAAHKDANFVSLLAIRNFGVPDAFPQDVIAETQDMIVPELGKRTDLRHLPLVTIDGEDARDFDDAVHAVEDDAPDNKGGWVITVAIADVAHYVRPGSALDLEAFKRGNSLYFPDRVVPMLPEALSNDMCSLRPDGPRACMAIIMRVNHNGHMIGQKIVRGLMQSKARLTYNQVQAALDGKVDATTKPILADVIMPLYGAYKVLLNARNERGTIDLDVPERKIELKNGVVAAIHQRERLESHKLIEEMMILANVAAATLLEEKNQPLLYRIHPKPDPVRLESTRNFLKEFGYSLKTGTGLQPKDFRQILRQTEGHDEELLINEIMLRTMSQAEYAPFNAGHFGLALERYAHFTSPIRRYADLIVHRALITAYGLGPDGLTDGEKNKLPAIGQHISDRERVAQAAERETIDRYVALFLQDKVGQTFPGRISGVTKAGLFITLDETGADGLLPMRLLPQDYFEHDEQRHMLIGRRSGLTFRLAQKVSVELLETDPTAGRLVLQLAPGSYDAKLISPRYRRTETEEPHRDRRDERERMDSRSGNRGGPHGREPREPRKFGRRDDAPSVGRFEREERPSFARPDRGNDAPRSPEDTWQRPEKRNVERKVYTRSTPDDRPPRDGARPDRFERSDRPARDDRPARPFGERSDRPAHSFDDRPPRGDFGDRKPFGKPAAPRDGARSDRPRDDRPPRDGARPPKSDGGWKNERGAREDYGAISDKPARAPRAEGGFKSGFKDKPAGGGFKSDRGPGKDFGSKPGGSGGRGGPKPPARGGGGGRSKPGGRGR